MTILLAILSVGADVVYIRSIVFHENIVQYLFCILR